MLAHKALARLAAVTAVPLLLGGIAFAQSPSASGQGTAAPAATQPAQKHVRSLVVLNARKADLANGKLSLDGVSASAIVFADRPIRRAGYMHTSDLVKLWDGKATFAKDPPNATVSAFAKDGASLADAVITLEAPKLEGDRLTFNVKVLEGDLKGVDGPASIFIDTIWFGIGGGDGIQYLGDSQTTGGTTPAFGSRNDTSNPSGWPNPSPNGSDDTTPPPPPNKPPLSAPPGYR
ncbi:hypothetical protein SAMN02745126_01868 [Enhydrobacter aerosaccus]|uniref:Uncharacterized protein n=1 Tax=Enhydrobacter aerosaccus TaxID=225324 RepID=A0A1T4MMB3_9HYPH|nr:hypothetical protein [Enhydrobacter aerosaccus]SJZ67848.1 hypothetical protein SAMN02745126_01868 [Enhydrobacter aerosaccus]